jgi:hypothetical protein
MGAPFAAMGGDSHPQSVIIVGMQTIGRRPDRRGPFVTNRYEPLRSELLYVPILQLAL